MRKRANFTRLKVSWQPYSSRKVALRSITLNTVMTARAQWELLFRETCRRRVDASIYASMDISTCVQSSECNSLVADASNERESSKRNRAIRSSAFSAFAPSELIVFMHLVVCVAFVATSCIQSVLGQPDVLPVLFGYYLAKFNAASVTEIINARDNQKYSKNI